MLFENKSVFRLVKRHQYIDDWFPFRYSLDLESGCAYKCVFCRVNWREEKTLIKKENALEIFEKEVKGIPKNQLIGLGGGYNELFSKPLDNSSFSKRFIHLLIKNELTPFILTRSQGVSILLSTAQLFSKEQLPVIAMSISSVDNASSQLIEPDSCLPSERLEALIKLVEEGFKIGICYMPVIPFFNDSKEEIEITVVKAKEIKSSFILFNMLDKEALLYLWERDFFSKNKTQRQKVKELLDEKETLKAYYLEKEFFFIECCKKHKILPRIERSLFSGKISLKDEITVVLARLYYYFFYLKTKKDGFRFAAYSLNKLSEEEFEKHLKNYSLDQLSGFGKYISEIVYKMVYQKNFDYYEKNINAFF